MSTNSLVRARISQDLKNQASAVLAEMGLTVSDVVRIVLTRVAKEHALPFEMNVPNSATRAAMEEARTISRARFGTGAELIHDLENARQK
jgi:DNA-damage-inducible protein J